MHLLKAQSATPEDAGEASDLGQSPGDLVFLSAANDDVARVYSTIGFTRVATACIAEP